MLNLVKTMFLCSLLIMFATQSFAFPGQSSSGMSSQTNVEPSITIKGSVVETMNAAGYTYLCLENEGQKRWAAIPESQVSVGDQVEISQGMVMTNFSSKTLGRTFDEIIFSQGIVN